MLWLLVVALAIGFVLRPFDSTGRSIAGNLIRIAAAAILGPAMVAAALIGWGPRSALSIVKDLFRYARRVK